MRIKAPSLHDHGPVNLAVYPDGSSTITVEWCKTLGVIRTACREPDMTCEVCDRVGADAERCMFEHACSCWYGVPCKAAR